MAKVLLSLDEALLARIDRLAKQRGMTRSAYFAQLARDDIARTTGPGRQPSVRRALARLDRLLADTASGDSTAAIREQRDAR